MACKDVQLCLVILGAILAAGRAEEYDHFHYDYKTLRMGGLIFAGAMLVTGMAVLLSDLNLFKRKHKGAAEARSKA